MNPTGALKNAASSPGLGANASDSKAVKPARERERKAERKKKEKKKGEREGTGATEDKELQGVHSVFSNW